MNLSGTEGSRTPAGVSPYDGAASWTTAHLASFLQRLSKEFHFFSRMKITLIFLRRSELQELHVRKLELHFPEPECGARTVNPPSTDVSGSLMDPT